MTPSDNVLSDWSASSVFETLLRTSRLWTEVAHNAGVATIWYFPALEIISHNSQTTPTYSHTFPNEVNTRKYHIPASSKALQVQIGIDGKPNLLAYPQVFWLAPGDESAWLSPNGPYKQVFMIYLTFHCCAN